MEAADIRILKAKCNKLIEKALCLKEEIEKKDLEIKELEEQKKSLDMAKSETSKVIPESEKIIEQDVETSAVTMELPQVIEERKIPQISQQQIFDMIYSMQNQDKNPPEEIVVRHLSAKAKIIETVTDMIARILKFLALAAIMILLSLAATVLLNGELRNMVIEFIERCIG
ncbi:MAG: hypothetical protein ACI4SA_04245 [Lachnospiraceae bacterium]